MVKKTGLGKGLDALFGSLDSSTGTNYQQIHEINLNQIQAGIYQPRKLFNDTELQQLAESIKANGVIAPIIIRKVNNIYEIIAGERRYRASELAGLKTIPAIIREVTDQEALAIALIENIQRADLNIIEEAQGYNRLINEFNFRHLDIANITNKSRSHITNLLRILQLPDQLQQMLINSQLTMGHARALLTLPTTQQLMVANRICEQALTTRQTEQLVNRILNPSLQASVVLPSLELKNLQASIAKKLGLNVKLKLQQNGTGKVIISYNDIEQLKRLLK